MARPIFYKSDNGNFYIYDYRYKYSMLVHPSMKKILNKEASADSYYLAKYEYLKRYNFFSEPASSVQFGKLTEAVIKESLKQITQITFEVTDFCNLNCTYCSFGDLYEGFDERNQKNLDLDSAIKLIDYVFNNKPRNKAKRIMIGFYGGEPLYNGALILQIVGYINKIKEDKDIDIEYTMTTNATLLHKYIDFLVANKFHLLISLDGDKYSDSYRQFKNGKINSFNRVIENVDLLYDQYPIYFEKFVEFNSVLHDRNSVKSVYEFIYNRYQKIPRIAQLAQDDVKKEKMDKLKRMFNDWIKSEIEFQNSQSPLLPKTHRKLSLYRETLDFLKYHSENFYISDIMRFLYDKEKILPTSTCLPGQKKILLTTHNKLFPCEKVNYKYGLGKVSDQVELNISNISKQYQYYYEHIEKVCRKCYLNRFCSQCVFHIKNLDHVADEDFTCEYFCDAKRFEIKLSRIFSFLEKYPEDFHVMIEEEVLV